MITILFYKQIMANILWVKLFESNVKYFNKFNTYYCGSKGSRH